MTTITTDYQYVFDSVSFGIDVREKRWETGLTQEQLAKAIGHETASIITRIETASHTENFTLRDYIKLCNLLQLQPTRYWDTHPVDGSTQTEILF